MDRSKNLILKNGEDITEDVISCKHNIAKNQYNIMYRNGKTYFHKFDSIEWITNPKSVYPNSVRITRMGRSFFDIETIHVFSGLAEYWHIRFANGNEKMYLRSDLDVTQSCLNDKDAKNCLEYLREIAKINNLKSEDGKNLLAEQYRKIDFVGYDTALAVYLNPEKPKLQVFSNNNLIFPFGGNESQFKAVKNALTNQISVIQGPPGTGKTQTILNIIANLLAAGKTVQVVSNNNSATLNILEKLASPQYNMDFLAAPLGSAANKASFLENQTGCYPDKSDWKMNILDKFQLKLKIESHIEDVTNSFADQERLAKKLLELDSFKMEIKHFEQYCIETNFVSPKNQIKQIMDSKTIMQILQECSALLEKRNRVAFWFKIKYALIHRIANWNYFKNSFSIMITFFQKLFYEAKIRELNGDITALKNKLELMDVKTKMKELSECSMAYLRSVLFEHYGDNTERKKFDKDDFWKNSSEFVQEYPIVLSTTFSSISSLKGVIYDYLIMDEASQVDLATGALALSCAKNAVIVGDLKQLPNIVSKEMRAHCNGIFDFFKLPQGYSFSENSFLKSVCSILPDVPQTMLREHYRCHPKIIGFCNQKFYNNELVIMTEDHNESNTLTVFKTVEGNHQRDHINQRQIDIIINQALPLLDNINLEHIGIIAPYRNQVETMKRQINSDKLEVDTVHKFQGREKDTIILTTVDNEITDFSDDPYLLNVAISRAKKHLILVVSGNEQPVDSNIHDLISFIEYNSGKIIQSEIRSVFDLLYRQYTNARIAFLQKQRKVSAYDSENLIYHTIVDIIEKRQSMMLNVVCHHPLYLLLRSTEYLNDNERRYVMNPAAHVDFLIYHQMSKKPVLAVEVDGFHYHKKGTRQYERDMTKNHILELYRIPLLRLSTNGSKEQEKIEQFLDDYSQTKPKLFDYFRSKCF